MPFASEQHNFRIQLPTEVSLKTTWNLTLDRGLEPTNPDPPAVSFVTVTDSLAEVHWTYDDEGNDNGSCHLQLQRIRGRRFHRPVGPGVFQFLVVPWGNRRRCFWLGRSLPW